MTEADQDQPGPPETSADGPPPPPPADIAQLAAERDRLNDQFLRAKAELANVLKRAERDRGLAALAIKRDFVAALLPAMDALDLAIRHGSAKAAALLEGVKAARDALSRALASQGAERIPAEGAWDPDLHHVTAAVERADLPEGTILEEIRPGWRVGSLVARHGEVVVSRRPAEQPKAEPQPPPEERKPEGRERK